MVTNQDEDAVPTNVLLAEDDPMDRLEVRLHLELMGFIVYDHAYRGQDFQAGFTMGSRSFSYFEKDSCRKEIKHFCWR